jgi:hypothetical protein
MDNELNFDHRERTNLASIKLERSLSGMTRQQKLPAFLKREANNRPVVDTLSCRYYGNSTVLDNALEVVATNHDSGVPQNRMKSSDICLSQRDKLKGRLRTTLLVVSLFVFLRCQNVLSHKHVLLTVVVARRDVTGAENDRAKPYRRNELRSLWIQRTQRFCSMYIERQ